MITLTDVLNSINNAFPFFSYGEGHINESLEKYSFDESGIKQRWDMFDRLSRNIMEFLRSEFPYLGESSRSIYCELQMCQLYEKIERIEQTHKCYCSLMAQCSEAA